MSLTDTSKTDVMESDFHRSQTITTLIIIRKYLLTVVLAFQITQIVTPFNHNASQWWRTDIILMKTLYPFNITNVVNAIDLNNKAEYDDKSCVVLVYAVRS